MCLINNFFSHPKYILSLNSLINFIHHTKLQILIALSLFTKHNYMMVYI